MRLLDPFGLFVMIVFVSSCPSMKRRLVVKLHIDYASWECGQRPMLSTFPHAGLSRRPSHP